MVGGLFLSLDQAPVTCLTRRGKRRRGGKAVMVRVFCLLLALTTRGGYAARQKKGGVRPVRLRILSALSECGRHKKGGGGGGKLKVQEQSRASPAIHLTSPYEAADLQKKKKKRKKERKRERAVIDELSKSSIPLDARRNRVTRIQGGRKKEGGGGAVNRVSYNIILRCTSGGERGGEEKNGRKRPPFFSYPRTTS